MSSELDSERLAHSLGRNVEHCSDSSSNQSGEYSCPRWLVPRSVIAGFSFHIGPFPSIFIGVTKNHFVPGVLSEIAVPARRPKDLHGHELGFKY